MDLWNIRLEALRYATTGSAWLSEDEMIQRAHAIEQYVKHGYISPDMRKILDAEAASQRVEN